MPKRSAGILLWQRAEGGVRVLLVHPGGPFWAKKDAGAWSIPKGEYAEGDDVLAAAKREFAEELGPQAQALVRGRADDAFVPLAPVQQAGGKIVAAFALEGDLDVAKVRSNIVAIEWPPGSGRRQSFPEIDRAQWFSLAEARRRILPGQRALLAALAQR